MAATDTVELAELNLPAGCEVCNCLYRTSDPEYLTQDILQVKLPNGYYVDVGWAPENDANGEYTVRVFRGQWENQCIVPITAHTVDDVVRHVKRLAEEFMRGKDKPEASE